MTKFKVGQCLRLKKYENAGLAGASAEAHKKLYGHDAPPHQQNYVYLRVTKFEEENNPWSSDGNYASIFGTDLKSMGDRAFRQNGTGKWVEFNPTSEKKILDFWGYDEVVVLSIDEVGALVNDHYYTLRKTAESALKEARTYYEAARKFLRSA